MKTFKKPIVWLLLGVALFATLLFIFLQSAAPKTSTVNKPNNDGDAQEVFEDFRYKVLAASPAGQHYRDLILKHSEELNEIYNEHPGHEEHRQNLIQLMEIFKPVMQDSLAGNGNKVQITREQIDLLQSELDWISEEGSPALRRDVEEEWQRFQLEIFVGMTLSEALDLLNADLPPEVAVAPTVMVTLVPTQYVAPPVCKIGNDIDCLAAPSILPDSNGQWAYATLDGLYFEYPADWRVEPGGGGQGITLYLIPPQSSIEELKTRGANITVRNDTLATDFPPPPSDNPIWNQWVSLPDFEGEAFMVKHPAAETYILQAYLYDQEHERMVFFGASIYDEQAGQLVTTPEIVEENISRFKHMVESVKIADEGQLIPPTAVGAPSAFIYPDTFWAQEIVNGVSFEYPHDSPMTRSEGPDSQTRSFIPEAGTLEALHVKETFFAVIPNVAVPENAPLDALSCSTDPTTPQPDSLWHEAVTLDDFEGSQFLWKDAGGRLVYLEVVLYNRDLQKMICIVSEIYPEIKGESTATPENARVSYPIFYHMLESIRIADE